MRYNLYVKRHKVLWLSLKLASIFSQVPSTLIFIYAFVQGVMEFDKGLLALAALYLPVSIVWAYLASLSFARLWAISGNVSQASGLLVEIDEQLYIDTGKELVYLDSDSAKEVKLSKDAEWSVKLYERSGIVVCAQRIGY